METMNNVVYVTSSSIKLQELIGSGGFGDVFKAVWQGTTVAVKKLHIKSMNEDLKNSFIEEAKILAKCNFPHMVRLYGVCMETGNYSMVMELLPKGSLYDVIHNPKEHLEWTKRWQISVDIITALAYLHTNNIIHRDLKSLNVLLDNSYRAKITDFGLAKVKIETSTTTQNQKNQIGSTRWRAPELFKRRSSPTFASDVFSFGMILWEIASRKLPFADALDDATVISWISNGELEEIPSDCPESLAIIIQSCWKEPAQRPPATGLAEVMTELHQAVLQENLAKSNKPKPWHFDNSLEYSIDVPSDNGKKYTLFPASKVDTEKVVAYYQHHPVPKMDIKSVQVIHNPALNQSFELRLGLLQQRAGKPAFAPRWKNCESNDEELAWRQTVNELWENLTSPYKDEEHPDVKLLPVWHGTSSDVLEVLFETGYANLATTDSGYFGKGIYSSYEAEYAHRVYSKGALILNWISVFSALPTVYSDMAILQGKGNFENYDAHFVPVIPPDGNPSTEGSIYYPCKPNETHQYLEIVVFESHQCLPRFLVELQPSLPKIPNKPQNLLTAPTRPAPTPTAKPTQVPNVVSKLRVEASSGNLESQLKLAAIYMQGSLEVQKDETEAIAWYQKAAKQGSAKAQFALGKCFLDGTGVDKNLEQAAEWFEKAAEQGDPLAQYELAMMYFSWDLLGKNFRLVKFWLEKSAVEGLAVARYQLARMYTEYVTSEGGYNERNLAFYWYEVAAQQGHLESQFYVGKSFAEGSGTEANLKKAVEWYLKAAERGFSQAQVALGKCYLEGKGVVASYKQACSWFRRAADAGHLPAMVLLGQSFQAGEGVPQDYARGMEWFQKAAKEEHPPAEYYIGLAYEKGEGVTPDFKQAVTWYHKAALGQHMPARLRLALLWKEGKGFLRSNLTQAWFWLDQVRSPKNEAEGQDVCAEAQYEKSLLAQDEYHSCHYLLKAAHLGFPKAQLHLGIQYKDGNGRPNDYSLAAYWFKQAAANEPKAAFYLGCLYAEGLGVKQDTQKASRHFQQATYGGYMVIQKSRDEEVVVITQEELSKLENSFQCEEKTLDRYRKAAQQGNANGQCALGFVLLYMNGDLLESLFWLRKSAEQENSLAQFYLGRHYLNKDDAQAFYWLKKAADNNYGRAQLELARLYANGKGVTKDSAKAIEIYQKAAENGQNEAYWHIGTLYFSWDLRLYDLQKALYWAQKGAEHDITCVHMAGLILDERGENQQATKYFESAAERNYAPSQYHLAARMRDGKGTPKNMKQAMIYWNILLSHDFYKTQAAFELAWSYFKGIGVPTDLKLAAQYFQKSAENGCIEAATELGYMYYKGHGVKKDYKQALHWFEFAKEDPRAAYGIGKLYEKGNGVHKDFMEASKWYIKSEGGGYEKAKAGIRRVIKKQL